MRVVAVFLLVNSVLLSFHAGAQQEGHLNSVPAFIGVTGEVRRDQAGTVGWIGLTIAPRISQEKRENFLPYVPF